MKKNKEVLVRKMERGKSTKKVWVKVDFLEQMGVGKF